MTIAVTGFSHHTSPLLLRERMSLSPDEIADSLPLLQKQLGHGGSAVILSTCNRFEIYAFSQDSSHMLQRKLISFLGSLHGMEDTEFSRFLYHHSNHDAVHHLFRVASSLDSMVVGESEIMGQIQNAYDIAGEVGTLNRILGALFQRALKCGKRVRTETRISEGKVSVASVAVDLAESVLNNFTDKTAMIVGSGKISEQALKNLVERGIKRIMVLNRTVAHAKALAESYHGEALILGALPCHLHRADIVISSTGAPDFILSADDFKRAIERRNYEPMFVIDLAVPRDIEREASKVNNVYCYDLDDLQRGAECNLQKRQSEIQACETIVEKEVKSFLDWQSKLHAEPFIVEMTKRFNEVREQELKRTLKKLNNVDPAVCQEIDRLTKRIVNTLLNQPITCMKRQMTEDERDLMLNLAQRMFSLQGEGHT